MASDKEIPGRWAEVTAPRFDYMLSKTSMLSAVQGQTLYLPQEILDYGIATGQLRKIGRPAGAKVSKAGRVIVANIGIQE